MTFRRTDLFPGRTSLRGYAEIAPMRLIELFGQPSTDEDKCSGEYWFTCEDGGFAIYDWMAEDRYGGCNWNSTEPYRFNVGGTRWAGDFIDWIEHLATNKEAA